MENFTQKSQYLIKLDKHEAFGKNNLAEIIIIDKHKKFKCWSFVINDAKFQKTQWWQQAYDNKFFCEFMPGSFY